MSTLYFIFQETMFFAIPLLIVSLGGLFSEKSGVSNIALEGIMIMGAFFGVITLNAFSGTVPSQLLFLLSIAVSGIVGGAYSLLHAWASVSLRADQTISGTALNLFAPAFCIFVSRSVFGAKNLNFSDPFHIEKVPVLSDIPVIGPMFFENCYLSTYIGLALFIAAAVIFSKTRFGMRLSACGENPGAAASVGIRVLRTRYIGVIISGVLGGIGGIIFIIPTTSTFSSTVAGYGFLALAVLILGQWKPLYVLLASFFFGILKAVSSAYSGIPFLSKLSVPSEIYKMIPYVLTLAVLMFSSQKSAAPKALSAPYDEGKKTGSKTQTIVLSSVVAGLLALTIVVVSLFPAASHRKNAVSNGYGADIALLVDPGSSVDDEGYLQSIWEAVIRYSDEADVTRKYYQAKDSSEEGLKKCADLAVKGKADIVIASASTYETTVGAVQFIYPDNTFIIFDGEPTDLRTGEKVYGANTLSVSFANEESGFLAGYAAVIDGYRNLGYIGGMAVTSVVKYGYGFAAGCDYAAKELGLAPGEVKIRYCYAGTFAPNPEVQAMASSWYHSGIDVIFAAAGGATDSVIKAAENSAKFVIGVDLDKSSASETVVTSAMIDTSAAMGLILNSYYSGTLTTGRNICLTAKDECVKLPMETSRFKVFTQADYDRIYSLLASESLDIPTNTTAPTPDLLDFGYVEIEYVK